MKFFIAFVALIAVASALPRNKPLSTIEAELQAIIEAINSPSTDPATAILLQEQLDTLLGVNKPEGIPIDTNPAIVEEAPEAPAPAPAVSANPPTVHVTINIGTSSNDAPINIERPTPGAVIERPEAEVVGTPVQVVEQPALPAEPVVVAPIVPVPVQVIPDILN